MIAITLPDIKYTREYQAGFEAGVKCAESYFKGELKDFYKKARKGMITSLTSVTCVGTSKEWKREEFMEQLAEITKQIKELEK